MIKVEGLVKSYGSHRVLGGIDFEVKENEIYGFVGHNGAGKSTTMNILAGLIQYNAGSVKIGNMEIKEERQKIMRIIGYLPEEPQYYPYMNALEYLNFVGLLSDYDQRRIQKRTEELLEQVKLKDAAKRRIGGYSRGMRQRLGIAVAVYNHPKVVLLDEPASALDPEGRKDMLDLINVLRDTGNTVFFSTHILSDVEKVCDKVGILNGGKIVLEGKLEELNQKYIFPIYDVHFESSCEGFDRELEKYHWIDKVIAGGNFMSIHVKNREIAKKELLKIISLSGNPVLSYHVRKSSLEEIFMRVVKENEEF